MTTTAPAATVTSLDDAPVTSFHRRLMYRCAGGPFLDGYVLSIVSVAVAGMTDDLHLSVFMLSAIGAAALVGILVGAAVFGPITDKIGREVMYILDVVVLVGASLLSAFAATSWQVLVLRFVIGLAIGADYPIATSLLAEWLPRHNRGRMLGALIVFWYVGATAAYVVGLAIIHFGGDDLWRWILVSSAIPGVVVLLMRIGTPESPRWLVQRDRKDAARRVISKVFGDTVDADAAVAAEVIAAGNPEQRASLRTVFRGRNLRRITFCGLFFLCQVTPLFAIYTFGPVILQAFGLNEGVMAYVGSALISLLFLIGCVPALRWVDSWGRRPLIVWSFGLMAIPLAVLGIAPTAPIVVIVICFCLYALFSGGPNVLDWTYPSELFPTEVRATAIGISTGISRIGAAVGTFLLPVSLDEIGVGPTMLIGAALTVVGFVACLAWAEETKDTNLGGTAPVHAG
ncbi:MFS transporter [Nocardia sp. NBC_00881]|uniref:MFS transporter n=1 Tax=Nocardia sp. NBC_00881 TaxID=2975995 RepID=UPI00386D4638|nr:MFS transporter [Nocardia sp. NBC_00881]